jgi:hypothetical protein
MNLPKERFTGLYAPPEALDTMIASFTQSPHCEPSVVDHVYKQSRCKSVNNPGLGDRLQRSLRFLAATGATVSKTGAAMIRKIPMKKVQLSIGIKLRPRSNATSNKPPVMPIAKKTDSARGWLNARTNRARAATAAELTSLGKESFRFSETPERRTAVRGAR